MSTSALTIESVKLQLSWSSARNVRSSLVDHIRWAQAEIDVQGREEDDIQN